jgi:hypothetical protein
MESAKKG